MKFQIMFTKEEKQGIEKTIEILKNIREHNFTELNGTPYSIGEIDIAVDVVNSLYNYQDEKGGNYYE